ncbi:2-keto-4-pentenoate hydratase [Parvibium lacunae]|uniref:Fumarylacetoacetate hydrolase n=1 Tax=Parvibium lacunae TaxID=1888893 RepID=A0A368L382_9BURK|nr:fumarylacetoacetate hydrolase [Parvibium lacunae]RCS58051.1 fumarylacetoacetate hydrolase [Parvibium lacunae]
MFKRCVVVMCLAWLPFSHASAACLSDLEAAQLASRYVNKELISLEASNITAADALCSQQKVVRYLQQAFGPVAGYKAGLTNPATQKRFGADAPVAGVLFKNLLLTSPAKLPAQFGARPLFEADLLVEVKDAGIMQARTQADLLKHVKAVIPFIELPDLAFSDMRQANANSITIINVGARQGALGKPLPMTAELVPLLASMQVKLLDDSGAQLDSAPGTAILDHPLNAVLWLVQEMQRRGVRLKAGDLLSLGSFSKLIPSAAGKTIMAIYDGLPGNPQVVVRFE